MGLDLSGEPPDMEKIMLPIENCHIWKVNFETNPESTLSFRLYTYVYMHMYIYIYNHMTFPYNPRTILLDHREIK